MATQEDKELLKDKDYRLKMGKEAKLSLNKFTNEGTTNLWGRLFNSLNFSSISSNFSSKAAKN